MDAVGAAASGSDARYRFNGDGTVAGSSSATFNQPPQSAASTGPVISGQLYPKHLEGLNIAFVDGHVKWYRSEGGGSGPVKAQIYRVGTPFTTSQNSPTFRAK